MTSTSGPEQPKKRRKSSHESLPDESAAALKLSTNPTDDNDDEEVLIIDTKMQPGSGPSSAATTTATIQSPDIQELPKITKALINEKAGNIRFKVVVNDESDEMMILLTGLKNIFQKQLPKMPKEYIARLVYDRYINSIDDEKSLAKI